MTIYVEEDFYRLLPPIYKVHTESTSIQLAVDLIMSKLSIKVSHYLTLLKYPDIITIGNKYINISPLVEVEREEHDASELFSKIDTSHQNFQLACNVIDFMNKEYNFWVDLLTNKFPQHVNALEDNNISIIEELLECSEYKEFTKDYSLLGYLNMLIFLMQDENEKK